MNQYFIAKYGKIVFHIFRNFYANRQTIIDGSISSLPSVRSKTMAIRFSDKFFPLPVSLCFGVSSGSVIVTR